MPLTTLTSKHREIARMKLLGLSNDDIATQLDMTPTAVSIITNSPLFRHHLEKLMEEADNRTFNALEYFRNLSKDAAEVISDIMKDPDTPKGTKLSAAKIVLSMAGVGNNNGSKRKPIDIEAVTFEQTLREAHKQLPLLIQEEPENTSLLEDYKLKSPEEDIETYFNNVLNPEETNKEPKQCP